MGRAGAAGLRSLGVLGLAIAAVLGPGAPAEAHNSVVSTTPAEGETLTELPETFEIRTNDALLDLSDLDGGFAFLVQDADGLYYGDGCVRIVGPSMFTTPELGAAGDYTVSWQLLSGDGHTISGSYRFDWQPPAGFAPAVGTPEPPSCGAAPGPTGSEPPDDSERPGGAGEASGDGRPADAWWIAGTAAAAAIAVVVTVLLVRRRGGSV